MLRFVGLTYFIVIAILAAGLTVQIPEEGIEDEETNFNSPDSIDCIQGCTPKTAQKFMGIKFKGISFDGERVVNAQQHTKQLNNSHQREVEVEDKKASKMRRFEKLMKRLPQSSSKSSKKLPPGSPPSRSFRFQSSQCQVVWALRAQQQTQT